MSHHHKRVERDAKERTRQPVHPLRTTLLRFGMRFCCELDVRVRCSPMRCYDFGTADRGGRKNRPIGDQTDSLRFVQIRTVAMNLLVFQLQITRFKIAQFQMGTFFYITRVVPFWNAPGHAKVLTPLSVALLCD